MLRSPARFASSYRVTLSSEAWKRIGLLPYSTFQKVRAALDSLASNLGARRPPGEDADTELRTRAAGLLLLYQRDDDTRTVTLVDFLPAPPER
jgi:mRNA-degrading endonuclease RelE of RelBE toxin-antitoxin system